MSFPQSLGKALGPLTYSGIYEREIKTLRSQLPGGLGIDRLLSYAGVPSSEKQYPPVDRESFLKLVEEIETGSPSRVYQSRAIYYLFLDASELLRQKSEGVTTVAEYYASQIWMSEPEQSLINGLWYLDHSKPEEALHHLGQPWQFDGEDSLHEYIVDSLCVQKPEAVASYLAARGPSNTYGDQLVKSLTLRGKFAEALDIVREHQNLAYLKELTRVSTTNKETSLELSQLPLSTEEWDVVQDELNRIIANSSSSGEDKQTTISLARNIILVRALHTGDTETLVALEDVGPDAELFMQQFLN